MSVDIAIDNVKTSNAGLHERLDSLRTLKSQCRDLGYYDLARQVQRDVEALERRLSCTKIRHTTRQRAEDHLAQLLSADVDRKDPKLMRVYPCTKCPGYWHVGHLKER